MKKVLLIEDEIAVVDFLKKGLVEQGYEVSVALDGPSGYDMAVSSVFDIIILDIMLPEQNGLNVCKRLRDSSVQTPILFLTALGTAENIAHGLHTGADDYLVKPFKFIELDARVKALIRRADKTVDTKGNRNNEVYSIADLMVDNESKTVIRNNVSINLTANEYRLLLTLIKNRGKVLSRMDLLEGAWDINFNVGTNVVDVYINYLRKKIDLNSDVKLIHTVVGMGYVLKEK